MMSPSDEGASEPFHFHIGRSWHGTSLEDDCPCGKAPCGLVDTTKIDPGCSQHAMGAAKTMRQMHLDSWCRAELEKGAVTTSASTG